MNPHSDDPAPKTSGETGTPETDHSDQTDQTEATETPAPTCVWKPGMTHEPA